MKTSRILGNPNPLLQNPVRTNGGIQNNTINWPLLVVAKGTKVPDARYNPRGFKDAQPRSLAFIESMLCQGNGLAVSCVGFPDGSRCIVLDVDVRNGGDATTIPERQEEADTFWIVDTGRGDGGAHYYYRTFRGAEEFSKSDNGIDAKHLDRGYVLVPPTLHPDTGRPYQWRNGGRPPLPGTLPPLFPPELEERFLLPYEEARRVINRATAVPRGDRPTPQGTPATLARIFRAAGLAVHTALPGGKLPVECPNSGEHTTQSPPSATVLLPTADGDGTFRCMHSHCSELLGTRLRVLRFLFARSKAARQAVRRDDPRWIRNLLPRPRIT